ncbi:hypothetical protein MMC24_000737 [Lignoscripta atroalba]|nr:hypothetical protein [Lignoscripta atroalba]
MWTFRLPLIQPSSPAALVAATLQKVLGDKISDYTYVDFCAGAGGPTPFIERDLNRRLGFSKDGGRRGGANTRDGYGHASGDSHINENSFITTVQQQLNEKKSVDFVLTDIAPHLEAWEEAAKKSDNLHFIPTSVDASNAPSDLLENFSNGSTKRKVFRLFSLAFHHFDDPLAEKILHNSIKTSDGFGIFELTERTFSSLVTCSLMWPLLLLISPFYFWRSPGHLFFTYVIPIIPFVVVFDGYVSSLRTRSAEEVLAMMGKGPGVRGWEFDSGSECHTFPIGEMTWLIGTKMH